MIRWVSFFVFSVFMAISASAMEIKEITTAGGIKAWLVENRNLPLITMTFSFECGSISDPPGKDGTLGFLTQMLDEGADDLDSEAFQARVDELAVKLDFNSGKDRFVGTFQTLSQNRNEAFILLKKALTAPHFEAVAMERIRQMRLLSSAESEKNPNDIAYREWEMRAYGNHPYARSRYGTVETIAAITADDLRAVHKLNFTRQGLKIVVVGDIDSETLSYQLDHIFGGLPDTPPPPRAPFIHLSSGPADIITNYNNPQTIINFGGDGILSNDPNYDAAVLMLNILGGGPSSRLFQELRNKRGLVYEINLNFDMLQSAGELIGNTSTSNDKVDEVITIIRRTMRHMADQGPTEQELSQAKKYLKGSYALNFDSSTKIADELLNLVENSEQPDYIDTYKSRIDEVTLAQVKEQARRLLHPDKMIITYVGQPYLH